MDKEQLKEQQDKVKAEQKDLEITARRVKERKEKAFDLGFIAAKQKKLKAVNPFESDEVVELTDEQKEVEVLAERWIAGYNRFQGG